MDRRAPGGLQDHIDAMRAARAPPCERRVLDMAGDGQNNEGIGISTLRKRVDFSGITVNGGKAKSEGFEASFQLRPVESYPEAVRDPEWDAAASSDGATASVTASVASALKADGGMV